MRAPHRVFLLSPANAGGLRAKMIMNENARFILARRLLQMACRSASFYVYQWVVFPGQAGLRTDFCVASSASAGSFCDCGGTRPGFPETVVTHEELLEIASIPVDASDSRYRQPLERDAQDLFRSAGNRCEVVLLGSIATAKYVEPLLGIFNERLLFPSAFVGRGDMSRGGLMLRSVREAAELAYEPVCSAIRHGPRPPKLPKLPRL